MTTINTLTLATSTSHDLDCDWCDRRALRGERTCRRCRAERTGTRLDAGADGVVEIEPVDVLIELALDGYRWPAPARARVLDV